MTIPASTPPSPDPIRWLNNQPYLLLSLTSLFWAGNIVLARYVAGHVPPMTLSCVRWIGAFLMLLPFAWPHLRRDWPALRARLPLMVVLSATGFAINNALSYWALQYTQALNALLIQSVGTAVRGAVVANSVRRAADLGAGRRHRDLANGRAHHHPARRSRRACQHPVQQGRRDVRRRAPGIRALLGADAAPAEDAPAVADLRFTIGCGALLLLPFSIWEFSTGFTLKFDLLTIATLVYVVIFPSTLAYLFFNRGIALIGPNRAAPFFHLVPVFGSAMAILLLGEQPRLFHLIGYLLVLAGVVIASRQASAKT